ncbi:3-phosphoglycerate dehydrogenase [Candidatus Micrarchaeota archaeon]|nr:3-phosphoglycerate dehydrogenase [Candidatus Micrarchaeota archaeon]
MKILIADKLDEGSLVKLHSAFDLDRAEVVNAPAQELGLDREGGCARNRRFLAFEQELATADVLIVRSTTKVNADLLAYAPNLKLVVRAGNGMDNIDRAACSARGIEVKNAADFRAVTEATVYAIIGLLRQIPRIHAAMVDGRWEKIMGAELAGKTVGIVGYGKIGSSVAKVLSALGANVIFSDVVPKETNGVAIKQVALPELLATSDIVSLHCDLTADNKGMINASALDKMKKGALLVNFARAELVHTDAVCIAIETGKLGGAHLDVFEREPKEQKAAFDAGRIRALAQRGFNVSLSSHIGNQTKEAQLRIADEVVSIIRNFIDARKLVTERRPIRLPATQAAAGQPGRTQHSG